MYQISPADLCQFTGADDSFAETGDNGLFFKGLLVVAPDEQWPQAFRQQELVMSSRDRKLSGNWTSSAMRKKDQEARATLQVFGGLVVKDERKHLVGVPVNWQNQLAGDFDGDLLHLVPAAGLSATAAHIEQKNSKRRGNPKLPKTFNPDPDTQVDMDKLRQLQGLRAWARTMQA